MFLKNSTNNDNWLTTCVEELHKRGKMNDMLKEIKRVYDCGEYTNISYLLRALAAITYVCPEQRSYVLWMLFPEICKTLEDVMEFLSYLPRQWGRTTRRAIESWMFSLTPVDLAYQMTKYRRRYGMTPKDILRLVHPRPEYGGFNYQREYNELFAYVTDRWYRPSYAESDPEYHAYLEDLEMVRHTTVAENVIPRIIQHKLGKEHIGCQMLLKNASVWNAILQNEVSPLDLLHHLQNNLVLFDTELNVRAFCKHLANITKYNGRPLHVLQPLRILKGKHVSHELRTALDGAFYSAFDAYRPTNLRYFVALDVSGSMAYSPCFGMKDISAREASALLAMTFVRKEPNSIIHAFSDGMRPLDIGVADTFEDIMSKVSLLSFDDTLSSEPILYALKHNMIIDSFVIITDSECDTDYIEALMLYRKSMNPNAQVVVVTTSSHDGNIVGMDPYVFDVIQTLSECV